MPATSKAAVFLILIPCLAACHDDKPKADTSQAASAAPIPSDLVYNAFVDDKKAAPTVVAGEGGAPVETETSASTAKLVDPGADPKAPLRYNFTGKARTGDANITISGSGGGAAMPDQPPLHFVFTAAPKPKNMLGHDATFAVTITKFDLTMPANTPPATAAQKDQLEKALVGVKGHFDVTAFGDVGDAAFDSDQLPRGAGDIVGVLQQAFELLAVPVPSEPVGIGAKWQKSDSKRMADQGANVTLNTTITLLARDAQTATMKVENTASGSMAVSDPRAPKGTTIDRKSKASFTVVVRFDDVAQKVDGQSTTDVTQNVPGQPAQSVTVTMTEKMTSK